MGVASFLGEGRGGCPIEASDLMGEVEKKLQEGGAPPIPPYWKPCGSGGVPTNSQISALIPPSRLLPLPLTFIPPPLTSFLVAALCSFTIFLLTSYFLYTQVMLIQVLIDVQYLQKAVFSFEKGLNGQKYKLSHPPLGDFSNTNP